MTTVLKLSELPPVQLQVYLFIRTYRDAYHYPPSVQEITEHLGVQSTSGVRKHLGMLEKKGYLTHIPTLSRTIVLSLNVVDDLAQTALPSPSDSPGVSNPTPDPSKAVAVNSEHIRTIAAEGLVREWRGKNIGAGYELPDDYWTLERVHPETRKQIELVEFVIDACKEVFHR
jgi:SOS-response transcriptional repressor LexA